MSARVTFGRLRQIAAAFSMRSRRLASVIMQGSCARDRRSLWRRHLQNRLVFLVEMDVAEGMVVVVGEEDEPAFGDSAGVEALALLDVHQRIEIVAHAPGDVEVGAGGDEVGDVAGMLAG